MLGVSVISKNVSESDGPSTFSKAKGIPSCMHTSLTVVKLFWHINEFGDPKEGSRPDNGEEVSLPSVPKSRKGGLPRC